MTKKFMFCHVIISHVMRSLETEMNLQLLQFQWTFCLLGMDLPWPNLTCSIPITCFLNVTVVIMYSQLLWLWRSQIGRKWTFLDLGWLFNAQSHITPHLIAPFLERVANSTDTGLRMCPFYNLSKCTFSQSIHINGIRQVGHICISCYSSANVLLGHKAQKCLNLKFRFPWKLVLENASLLHTCKFQKLQRTPKGDTNNLNI